MVDQNSSNNLNVVLFEPGIPQNVGNIARTCAAAKSRLHLIKPLGFRLTDKHLKRAGLDYWHHLDLTVHSSWEDFLITEPNDKRLWYLTAKADMAHWDADFQSNDYLVFGNENTGIAEHILKANEDFCIKVPMISGIRSLNLATTAGIVLFEALRQTKAF